MMETFAAAFSKTSPPSNTRVTPKPGALAEARPRVADERHAGAVQRLDVRAHGGLHIAHEPLEVVQLDAVQNVGGE